MMKRKICQFNARSKYWNYYMEEALDLFASKDLGEEEVQVSNGYGPFVMELLLCLAKRRKPFGYRF
jgi:hypothetical protein